MPQLQNFTVTYQPSDLHIKSQNRQILHWFHGDYVLEKNWRVRNSSLKSIRFKINTVEKTIQYFNYILLIAKEV